MVAESLAILFCFVSFMVGTLIMVWVTNQTTKRIAEVAKWRIVSDAGGNPMMTDVQCSDIPKLEPGQDSRKDIENKIKDRYGDEYELL